MFIPIEKISNLQEFKKDIFSGKVFVFQKSKTSNDLIIQIKNKIQNIYDGDVITMSQHPDFEVLNPSVPARPNWRISDFEKRLGETETS